MGEASTPQFGNRKPTSSKASRSMRGNRKRDTRPEVVLRRELWRRGLRYRLHARDLPGRPDIVFRRAKVAVFCDGDFWHGRDWPERERKLARGNNADYWIPKIQSNMVRDRACDDELATMGWVVVRIWESTIKADVASVVERVESALRRSGLAAGG